MAIYRIYTAFIYDITYRLLYIYIYTRNSYIIYIMYIYTVHGGVGGWVSNDWLLDKWITPRSEGKLYWTIYIYTVEWDCTVAVHIYIYIYGSKCWAAGNKHVMCKLKRTSDTSCQSKCTLVRIDYIYNIYTVQRHTSI